MSDGAYFYFGMPIPPDANGRVWKYNEDAIKRRVNPLKYIPVIKEDVGDV